MLNHLLVGLALAHEILKNVHPGPTSGLIQAETHREYLSSTLWPKYIKLLQSADLLFPVEVAQQNESQVLLIHLTTDR